MIGIGDIICDYIYSSFLLVKASLEVLIKTGKNLLKVLDTFFNTLMSLCQSVIDLTIQTVLNAIRVFQKWLVDQLLNLDYSALCSGLFKCTEFLEQILDPHSLLSRTMKKFTNYNQKPQEELYSIVNDFRQFQNQICNFGLTFNFGISAIKNMLNTYKSMCDRALKMLIKYKEQIRRKLQEYLDFLIDFGVMDLLDKLKKFFNCVLIDTDICSNIYTANSFYNTTLNKLCIEETGDGYRLSTEKSAKFMNAFDSRINDINNAKNSLTRLVNSMLEPSQIKAANNAFDIAKNIFPAGMTWTDVKKGNWYKNKCYSYFKIKRRDFIKAFRTNNEKIKVDTDTLMDSMTIDDMNGKITIDFGYGTETDSPERFTLTFDANNIPNEYKNSIENVKNEIDFNLISDGTQYNMNVALYDENTDTIISSLRGAIEITLNNNEDLKNKLQNKFNYNGFTPETDLIKSM